MADNDILLKLASCDLFEEFFAAFNVTAADVRILKTAHFSLRSNKHRRRMGEACFARLSVFLGRVADIDTAPGPTEIAALTEQTDKDIGPGEAVLFAVCPLIPKSVIVTGDIKSLVGLSAAALEDPVCERIYRSLSGRVICFELVLFKILELFGFDAVRQKMIDGRECDRGLALWLGSGLDASESSVREGINSHLGSVRRSSGTLLANEWSA